MSRHSYRASGRVWGRYLMAHLPSWLLFAALVMLSHLWLDWRYRVEEYVIAGWIAKDILLFPFLGRWYREPEGDPAARLIGKRGKVVEQVAPEGWVRLEGELWRARLAPGAGPLEADDDAEVEAVDGLTLVVTGVPADENVGLAGSRRVG